MCRVQQKISDGLGVLQFFTTRQWDFRSERFFSIFKEMTPMDQQLYAIYLFFTETRLFLMYSR